jgi:hypothetical protein
MALVHAYRHAPSVHHHSGGTGRKHPASSGPQSMVDNHRFCAAAKSYRVMGVWVYALATTNKDQDSNQDASRAFLGKAREKASSEMEVQMAITKKEMAWSGRLTPGLRTRMAGPA